MIARSRLRQVLLPGAFAIAIITLWEASVRWLHISTSVLAAPSVIWATLRGSFAFLLQHMVLTIIETVEGFVLASLLGIFLGTAITLSQRVRQALYPNILFFQLIPKIAVAPLFIVWIGVGTPSLLAFAVFMSFFPVALSTAAGLVGTSQDALRLCKSLTATNWQTFASVRFPFALPYIFAGLKIGMTMTMIGVIVGEFVTAQAGLGYVVMFSASSGETGLLFAALTLLCFVGLALYGCVTLGEMVVQRWFGLPVSGGGLM